MLDQGMPTSFPLRGLVELVLAAQPPHAQWNVTEDEFWCRVRPEDTPARVQGWKLHLSATPLSAPEVLHRAAQVLIRNGCAFKFAGRAEHVLELTGTRYDRAQCGKFITAYPHDDDQFRALAGELDQVTAGLPGPAILSDRPVRRGGIVHYRFGAFDGVSVLTNDGSYQVRLRRPDGSTMEDARRPAFTPPPWADLPLPGPEPTGTASRPVLIRDRYVVREAIQHSSGGGVYRASDRHTDADVVIKQARAHVGGGHTGQDARDTLRAEAVTLTQLAGLGPDLIEIFDQDGHTFLVETLVPGLSLASWVQERSHAYGTDGLPVAQVITLAERLCDLLDEVHRRGWVYRDFSPNNLMVDADLTVRLIDPELAVRPGEWVFLSHTPGYAAPEYLAARNFAPAPPREADHFALGAVLFYLVTGVNAGFAPDDPVVRPAAERMATVLGLQAPHNEAARRLAPVIAGLCAPDPAARWDTARVRHKFTETPAPAAAPPARWDAAIRDHLVRDGLAQLLLEIDTGNDKRLGRSTPFGAGTEPGNVQHGSAGLLSTLTTASRILAGPALHDAVARVAAWTSARLGRTPNPLPGLTFGRSGTAWALLDAGRHLEDDALERAAVELALAVPVRWPNPDLFHGAAGAGLTQLHFWRATGRPEFLHRAVECADGLLEAAEYLDEDVFWPVPDDFDSNLAGLRHFGYAHGVAGVGTFLLAAGLDAGRPAYLAAAERAGSTLIRAAELGPWGARWRPDRSSPPGTGMRYHLCSGSSGVGTFLVRLWAHTRDPQVWDLVTAAADAVHRTRWTATPSVCHGLAGNGEFLLDVADMAGTEGSPFRDRADDLAAAMYARHADRGGLMVLPDETGQRFSTDYQVGLAGNLAFLLRLGHGGPRPWTVPA
ncbi:serine/threonine protein kinase [Actinoplanes philippinensis]|uniref:non-specific serine/threonine protein kinase n=1 Tax=Actinoplanes philippinensis TaxID=35752 RepID=A0A1I1ZHG3_9ACTN|nr:class IV lanthionine synthetase LanL [Actinoplanes philippinensis]GIE75541.1 serine/threonine protein kinase [Actinoplanes philippinensis]SFE29780.1 Serine/threonine protein kinase [Actinoplanes philippinensis]